MGSAAQLTANDFRGPSRFPVNHRVMAEHRRRTDFALQVTNLSAHGFITGSGSGLLPGERVVIRLPHIGRIEAHLTWSQGERAGFQFERILRGDDLVAMVAAIGP